MFREETMSVRRRIESELACDERQRKLHVTASEATIRASERTICIESLRFRHNDQGRYSLSSQHMVHNVSAHVGRLEI